MPRKLTAVQVREIRERRARFEPVATVAADYGVSTGTISRVASGRGWVSEDGPLLPLGRRRGSQLAHAKLTEADIPEIRRRWRAGEDTASIGQLFGVSYDTAREAAAGVSWRHVPPPDR
jgi:hypothetical protein